MTPEMNPRLTRYPIEPTIMSERRPILSMTVRAVMVAMRFMKPTATLISEAAFPDAPACFITSGA